MPHNAFHSTCAVCVESVLGAASRAGAFAGIWSAWPQPWPESLVLVGSVKRVLHLKLPNLEDIFEAVITLPTFEVTARAGEWPREQWNGYLRSSLSGQGLSAVA